METSPVPARRPDVEKIFAYLSNLATQTDLGGVTDPLEQFKLIVRDLSSKYGALGEQPSLDGVTIIRSEADGVPGEWVIAADADPDRRMVWIHGGGWVGGEPEGYHRYIAAAISRAARVSVFLTDYRLAPEHRFPAGLEDCFISYAWVAEHAPSGDAVKARTLVLAGDSAGGNLAGAVCILAVQRGVRIPDRLVIVAGMMDNVQTPERKGADDPVCSPEALGAALALYVTDANGAKDCLVSPANAPAEILSRFPPTLLQASSTESLIYDCRRFAQQLQDAHVRVSLSVWPALPHVWHAFQNILPEAGQAIDEIVAFLPKNR